MSDEHYGPEPDQPEPEQPVEEEQDPRLQRLDGLPFYIHGNFDDPTYKKVRDSLLGKGAGVLGNKLPEWECKAEFCPGGCHVAIWLHDTANDEWYHVETQPTFMAHIQGMSRERLEDEGYMQEMARLNRIPYQAALN